MSLPWIFGPLVTRLMKRFGFRITAISGCLIISISFCASSFVDNFWFFLVLFSVTGGLGSAMSYHCSVLVVLRHFVKWRSLAVGITASSSSVGMFVVTQLTEVLISNYGFKNALRGWAILFFLATPLAFSYDPKSNVTVDNVKRIEEGSEKNVLVIPAPSLLQNGRFIIYLVSVTPVFFVVYTLSIFLVKFCESELGISSERGSMLYTYMAISYFFGNHLFCKLSEFKFINIFDLYQFSTTCLGVCLFLLPVATSYKAVVVLSVMFGLMDGGRYGLMPLIVLTCVGQKKIDQAWGYLTLFIGLSSVIGPVFIGFIADTAHEYGPAFYTAGGIMVFGSTVVFLNRFLKKENLVEEAHEEKHKFLEFFVQEKETVL
ncbi:unnamed protein product [Porites evermanni]|uniref:Major facilitator superfamily (MFS) profile domain-containing protein n=1 Tax=Porites evermanni TaxID=104178 RepID=A0ABN8QNK0_9CNID|nr:unnamed protein product [Porites evermanni]